MSLNRIYKQILKDVWNYGIEVAPRGMKVKELLGYSFILTDPTDNVITLKGFETNVKYAEEEYQWYKSGSNRIDYSALIEKVWKKYSDDGIHVNSAYGQYFFKWEVGSEKPMSQWEWVKKLLKKDPDSRQAVFNINQAYHKDESTKDFPCTIYCQVLIREGKLYWITNMRSNDVFFGLRNDVYTFTKLQQQLAEEMGLPLGTYTHFAGSMHLYEPQFEKVMELLQ